MKRRRRFKILAKNKIVFISLIVSMSFIGVGYAEWNDTSNINVTIETAVIGKDFERKETLQRFNEDEFITLTIDGDTLEIGGNVYSTFDESLTVNILDNGTVPSAINNVSTDNFKFSNLMNYSNSYNNTYKINEKKNALTIKVKPQVSDNNNELKFLNTLNSESQIDISSMENTIKGIENNKELYETIEKYNSNYTISYGLGGWEKELYIVCDINIIPDPTVLEKLDQQLTVLNNQMEEENKRQKKLLEELNALKELEEKNKLKEESEQVDNDQNNQNQDFYKSIIEDNYTNINTESNDTNDKSEPITNENIELDETGDIESIQENELNENKEEGVNKDITDSVNSESNDINYKSEPIKNKNIELNGNIDIEIINVNEESD